MSKINVKDATTNSVDSLRIKKASNNNSGGAAIKTSKLGKATPINGTIKQQLKDIKALKKQLTAQLKNVEKQEKKLSKQLVKKTKK